MDDTTASHALRILTAYCALEDTALAKPSRADRRLALQLVEQGVTFELIIAAFALTQSRRHQSATTHTPIRALAYFVPVIEELRGYPDPDYLRYLTLRFYRQKTAVPRDR